MLFNVYLEEALKEAGILKKVHYDNPPTTTKLWENMINGSK